MGLCLKEPSEAVGNRTIFLVQLEHYRETEQNDNAGLSHTYKRKDDVNHECKTQNCNGSEY